MRVRDIVVPFLTGALIFSINVAVNSCASQNRVEDDLAADSASGDMQAAPAKNDEMAALGEIPPEGAAPTEIKTQDGAPTEAKDQALEHVDPGAQAEVKAPEQALANTDKAAASGATSDDAEMAQLLPPDEANAAPPPPAADSAAAPAPTPAPVAPTPPEEAAASLESAPPPPTYSPEVEKTPVTRSRRRRSRVAGSGGGARAPKIPAEAIVRKKTPLNRFYFARRGDNAKKLAVLFYGDKKKAKVLARWNGPITPGKVVYYQSPVQADDRSMKSFYQERNVPTEEYEVKKGDWLSRIASKKLGNVQSWKEIAVTNGVDRPRKLEPGQKLALYPKNLAPYGAAAGDAPPPSSTASAPPVADAAPVAANDPAPQENAPITTPPVGGTQANNVPTNGVPTNGAPTNGAPTNGGAPVNGGAPTKAPVDTAPLAEGNAPQNGGLGKGPGPGLDPNPGTEAPNFLAPKKKKKAEGFDLMAFVDQQLLFIAVGVLLIVLLFALAIVNRRKRANSDEFSDDAFAPKARRR
jgi:LysM repeat protein